jgi:hypothetical protein
MHRKTDVHSRDLVICLLVVLVVGAIGFGFDLLLGREGVSRRDLLLLSNMLTGVVAGFLYYQLGRIERERRAIMQQRLRTIAEMNHHIRNALQVITYAASQDRADSVELIRASLERIEWALREVLPGYLPAEDELPSGQRLRQPGSAS